MGYVGSKPSAVPLTSADITDGIIVNADISATAAITSSKLSITSPLSITGNSTAGSEIRLPEDTDNGSNYVALKAADNIASNVTFTLPSADGTANQVLQTNGSGTLSFATISSDFVLLATTDASASSSVSFDGYFSSTYKNYRLIFSTVKSSANTQLFMRVRKSNADQTGANYSYAYAHSYRSASASGVDQFTGWNSTSVELDIFNNNGTNGRRNGCLDIFDPLNTDGWKAIYYYGFNHQNDDQVDCLNGGIFYKQTGALSGLSFYLGTGTITSGNFKLYGIK